MCWPCLFDGYTGSIRRRGVALTTLEAVSHSAITAAHRAKIAFVYVRQSSVNQVTHNAESTDLQYNLVERAVQLGWPLERVVVIDDDLGKSGGSSDERH